MKKPKVEPTTPPRCFDKVMVIHSNSITSNEGFVWRAEHHIQCEKHLGHKGHHLAGVIVRKSVMRSFESVIANVEW